MKTPAEQAYVYLVMGVRGVSDEEPYPICAYVDEAAAREHVQEAVVRVKALGLWSMAPRAQPISMQVARERLGELDPFISAARQVDYEVVQVVLVGVPRAGR